MPPNAKPLRVGILASRPDLFAPWEVAIFEYLKGDPRFEIVAIFHDGRPPVPFKDKLKRKLTALRRGKKQRFLAAWVFNKVVRLEQALLKELKAPIAEPDCLQNVPTVPLHPQRRGVIDRFDQAEAQQVADHDLDVLLRHGFNIIHGPLLEAAKHGIWSFHHADNRINRGGPAGFWEVYLDQPTTGVTLQRLTPELDGGHVLARAHYSTQFYYTRNQQHVVDKSVEVMIRTLDRFANSGQLEALPSQPYDGPLYKLPSVPQSLVYVGKLAKRLLQKTKGRVLQKLGGRPYCWQLFVGQGDFSRAVLNKAKRLEPPKEAFWADPFLYKNPDDQKTYVFFENYLYPQGRAKISVGRLDGLSMTVLGDALETDYHLSYPYVFAHEGTLYMIPEAAEKQRLEVWRCEEFPHKWVLHTTAFEGQSIIDATLIQQRETWWLFVTEETTAAKDFCSSLSIYQVDGPDFKTITPHAQNPVLLDTRQARPAGRPFIKDGQLYRPAQCNVHGIYGQSFSVCRVTKLSLSEYAEEVVYTVQPSFAKGLVATHHLDQTDEYFIIDGCFKNRF